MTRLRVAVHAHSTWSHDGRYELPVLARIFRRRGYDCVLMAEHEDDFDEPRWRAYRAACAEASRGAAALLLPGMEYADPDDVVHVPVWGDLPFLGRRRPTGDLLAEVARRGGAAMIAHPTRLAAGEIVAPEWLGLAAALEVWNRKTDGWAPSPDARRVLAARPGTPVLAGVDLHTRRQLFPLAAVLRIEGAATESAVVDALRRGRFRATAAGLPVTWFLDGPLWPAARAAEAGRRAVARPLRRWLNARRG